MMASMFSGAEQTVITGGTFVNVANGNSERLSAGFKLLLQHIARGALFNSSERHDPPRCHPGTRTAIQNKIKSWVEAMERDFSIFWLNGPAGVGKSAILQMIAEYFSKRERRYLLASFFFSRSVEGRNTERYLISTLAYQISLSVPQTRPLIERAIEEDPLIFDKTLVTQVEALIMEPLTAVSLDASEEAKERWPRLIIIDGLDECQDSQVQHLILQVLCGLLKQQPIPLVLLIASRTETVIRDAFNVGDLNRLSTRLALDRSYETNEDIQKLLEERCRSIRQQHESRLNFPDIWPSRETIVMLVEKSSGQFVYPSVVLKYIDNAHYNPIERLDIICGVSTLPAGENPFMELDSLYHHIFSRVKTQFLATALRILGVYIAYRNTDGRYSHPKVFSDIVLTEDFLSLKKGDLWYTLADLESVIHVSKGDIQFHHASLPEFLLDQSRSHRFHIDLELAHAHICIYLLEHIVTLNADYIARSWADRNRNYWWIGDLKHHIARAAPIPLLREALLKHNIFELSKAIYGEEKPNKFPWDLLIFMLDFLHLSKFLDFREIQQHILYSVQSRIVTRLERYREAHMCHYTILFVSHATFSPFFLLQHRSTLDEMWATLRTTLRQLCKNAGEKDEPDFDTARLIHGASRFPSGVETLRKFLRTIHFIPSENYARTVLFFFQFLFSLPPSRTLAPESWNRRLASFWETTTKLKGQNTLEIDDRGLLDTFTMFLSGILQPIFRDASPLRELEDFLNDSNMAFRIDFLSRYMKSGASIRDTVDTYLSMCSRTREAKLQQLMMRLTPKRILVPGPLDSPMMRSLGIFLYPPKHIQLGVDERGSWS